MSDIPGEFIDISTGFPISSVYEHSYPYLLIIAIIILLWLIFLLLFIKINYKKYCLLPVLTINTSTESLDLLSYDDNSFYIPSPIHSSDVDTPLSSPLSISDRWISWFSDGLPSYNDWLFDILMDETEIVPSYASAVMDSLIDGTFSPPSYESIFGNDDDTLDLISQYDPNLSLLPFLIVPKWIKNILCSRIIWSVTLSMCLGFPCYIPCIKSVNKNFDDLPPIKTDISNRNKLEPITSWVDNLYTSTINGTDITSCKSPIIFKQENNSDNSIDTESSYGSVIEGVITKWWKQASLERSKNKPLPPKIVIM